MKKHEVVALREEEPRLFERGLRMEENARNGKHGLKTVKGLGRNWAWAELAGIPVVHETPAARPAMVRIETPEDIYEFPANE